MEVINLFEPDKGTIKFKLFNQQYSTEIIWAPEQPLDRTKSYLVVASIQGPAQLLLLLQVADLLDRIQARWELYITYLFTSQNIFAPVANGGDPSIPVLKAMSTIKPYAVRLLDVSAPRVFAYVKDLFGNPALIVSSTDLLDQVPHLTYQFVGQKENWVHVTQNNDKYSIENPEILNNNDDPFLIVSPYQLSNDTYVKIKETLPEGRAVHILITHVWNPSELETTCNSFDKVYVVKTVNIEYKEANNLVELPAFTL